MSAATLSHRLKINNPHRILNEQDVSTFNKKNTLLRITEELESSLIATSIPENKIQQIENIFYAKEPYIKERNAILRNPFKYFNPVYRHRLKRIDMKLDELDLQLYVLESTTKEIELELEQEIKSAQTRLKKILEKP